MLSASAETFDSHSVQAALPPERRQTSPSSPSLSPSPHPPIILPLFLFPRNNVAQSQGHIPLPLDISIICVIFFFLFVARRLDLTKAIFFLSLSLLVSVTFSISLWRQTGRKKPVSRLDLEGRQRREWGG